MKRALLALPLLLAGSAAVTPAHALGARACTIDNASGTNTMTFTPVSAISGDWTWSFTGRDCIGAAGAPTSSTLTGSYTGTPCLAMVLAGQATGVITGGELGTGVGVTHAGPGTGYLAIESVDVLAYTSACDAATVTADVTTVQVHVIAP